MTKGFGSSPVSTTQDGLRAGFCVGCKNQAGGEFRPGLVPGRSQGLTPAKVPSGKVWPNGEFSLGWKAVGSKCDRSFFVYGDTKQVEPTWHLEPLEECNHWRAKYLPPLGLSLPRNHNRPKTYGRLGITGYGKKMVRSSAMLLQRKYGARRLSFLTLTIPDLPDSELRALAEQWGRVVQSLVQWLGRKLERAGLPKSVVLVTECQPRRAEAGSLGCLHIHAVFPGKLHRRDEWAVGYREVRSWWNGEISRRIGREIWSDSCENIQRVDSSAEGYLGKYMSKGGESAVLLGAAKGWECIPRQWWTATSNLKRAVKLQTFGGEAAGAFLEAIVNQYFDESGAFPGLLMAQHIVLDGVPYLTGYYGRFSKEFMKDHEEMMRPLPVALDNGRRN